MAAKPLDFPRQCAWQESNLPADQALSAPEDSTEDSTI
jgi:hypothetical protein